MSGRKLTAEERIKRLEAKIEEIKKKGKEEQGIQLLEYKNKYFMVKRVHECFKVYIFQHADRRKLYPESSGANQKLSFEINDIDDFKDAVDRLIDELRKIEGSGYLIYGRDGKI